MKTIFALLALTFAFNSHASLDQEDITEALAGQWSMSMDSGTVKLLVRSSGEISVISSAHHNYVSASLSFSGSDEDWRINGLPVAHFIISEGSDEDVRDVHFMVTAIQDGSDISLKKLASFSTFNDGPNDFSDVDSWSNFKKYDPKTKTWIEVK